MVKRISETVISKKVNPFLGNIFKMPPRYNYSAFHETIFPSENMKTFFQLLLNPNIEYRNPKQCSNVQNSNVLNIAVLVI